MQVSDAYTKKIAPDGSDSKAVRKAVIKIAGQVAL